MFVKCDRCGKHLPTTMHRTTGAPPSEDDWRYWNANSACAASAGSRMVPMCFGCLAPPKVVTALVAQKVEARS